MIFALKYINTYMTCYDIASGSSPHQISPAKSSGLWLFVLHLYFTFCKCNVAEIIYSTACYTLTRFIHHRM